MSLQSTLVLAFLAACGVGVQAADELVTVEVYCASEHVPNGLKAGARIDVMLVVGKTVTRTGKVSYSMNGVAQAVEVVSVTQVEKPKTPEEGVKVELRGSKSQAAAITRAKGRFATVTEATSDGKTKTERKPIPLRIEPTKD